MKKKYYLHVGVPKTATTFLQTKVFPNLSGVRFNDKEGLNTDFESDKLRNLGRHLIFHDSSSFCYTDLEKKIYEIENETKEDKILLSEESLSGYWARGFSNGGSMAFLLKDLFPSAKILLCIREQLDWLYSLYQYCSKGDVQKTFKVGSPDEFFYRNPSQFHWRLQKYTKTHVYCWANWYQHYTKYIRLFGAENVTIIPFELLYRDTIKVGELLSQFLDQDVDISETAKHVVNKSDKKSLFSSEQTELDFAKHVKSINADSNKRLDEVLLDIDLTALGYHCQ